MDNWDERGATRVTAQDIAKFGEGGIGALMKDLIKAANTGNHVLMAAPRLSRASWPSWFWSRQKSQLCCCSTSFSPKIVVIRKRPRSETNPPHGSPFCIACFSWELNNSLQRLPGKESSSCAPLQPNRPRRPHSLALLRFCCRQCQRARWSTLWTDIGPMPTVAWVG